MVKKSGLILASLCCCAGLVFAAPSVGAALPSFFDHFDVPGDRLDRNKWTTEFGAPSFLGRTQLQDWVQPGGVGKFVVKNSNAELALETYNPTNLPQNPSLYGTHGKTLVSFQPDASTGYDFTANIRLDSNSIKPGIVYGAYLYGCGSGNCATNHDELTMELVTNLLQPGKPLQVYLNHYANEPLGRGHPEIVTLPKDFKLFESHNWTIHWMPDRVTYLLDGKELFSAADHVPQGSMRANMIAWAPGPEWPDGYNGLLQPVTDPSANQRFFASVDSVSVSPVPEPAEWLMLLAGLGLVVVAAGRRQTIGRFYLAKIS